VLGRHPVASAGRIQATVGVGRRNWNESGSRVPYFKHYLKFAAESRPPLAFQGVVFTGNCNDVGPMNI
jgi:hypothetical protein